MTIDGAMRFANDRSCNWISGRPASLFKFEISSSIGKMVEGGLFNRYQNRGLQVRPVSNIKSSRFKGMICRGKISC